MGVYVFLMSNPALRLITTGLEMSLLTVRDKALLVPARLHRMQACFQQRWVTEEIKVAVRLLLLKHRLSQCVLGRQYAKEFLDCTALEDSMLRNSWIVLPWKTVC